MYNSLDEAELHKLQVGDRVMVTPRNTLFDRECWTIREHGRILHLHTRLEQTRALVVLDGTGGRRYSFRVEDLTRTEDIENTAN